MNNEKIETNPTLTENQKEMISEMLIQTKTVADIEKNSEKILGNAYGDKYVLKVYKELAKHRIQRFR